MRIGLFTDTYYPRKNGVATSVYMLKENLEAQGHTVYVITTSDPEAPEFERHVIRIPSIPLKTQRLGTVVRPQLVRLVGDLSLDIIHTHTEYTLGIFGRIMARRLGIPFVHTMHTVYECYTSYVLRSELLKPALQSVMRKFTASFCNSADMVIVPTDKVEDLLMSYGVNKYISVVPTGIPLERFSPHAETREAAQRIRAELGIAPGDKVLINIGRVAEEKNLDELIRSLRPTLTERDDVKFLIVGDGAAREGLETLCGDLDLSDRVIFAGERPWDEIGDYYSAGDIFVSASRSETQGLTYIEAMASALPVVAWDDRCLDGVLVDGENGFTFACDERLHDALGLLLDNEGIREKLGESACRTAQRFSAGTYAASVADLYMSQLELRELSNLPRAV